MTVFLRSGWVLAVGLTMAGAPSAASPKPPAAAPAVEERLGATLPLGEHFTTTKGERVRLGDIFGRGTPGLLVLSYARCAMLCGVVLRGVSDLMREYRPLPGERFVAVNISLDPLETPHEAARTQASTLVRAGLPGAVDRFTFVVGESPSIDAVAKAVGFRYAWDPATAQYAHPAVLIVISPEGRVARYFHGVRFDPEEVRAALHGQAAPKSLGEAVLSCFRSDVLERRYGGVIARAFQLGGLLVLAALGALLFVLGRRGRATLGSGRGQP